MFGFRSLPPRHRYLIAYVALILPPTALVCCVWPGQRWGIIVAMLFGLAVAWGLADLGSRSLRRRLRRLRETADAIARGDLARSIDRPPHDDFNKLADSLERMLDRLQHSMAEHERLRKQLTRSEKLALIGELAATVAHEVNNPLDGLQNSTRIIRRSLDKPEQVRQLLDMMEAGLYRIEMIVRRLLTMARDEPVNPVPTRMDDIVRDAAVFVKPRLDRSGIALIHDFPDSPPFALADRTQLVQALINLMINAADAMRDGGRLTLRCRTDEQNLRILFDMIDTGSGIPDADMPHIFEPFYTTKPKGSGTGLGLAVVARIIEAHNGAIHVTSQPGEGTTFRIELPAAGLRVERAKQSTVKSEQARVGKPD